jgi:hypothetical protein
VTDAGKPHLALIRDRLDHLSRMASYLAYSLSKVVVIVPRIGVQELTADDHESLAAFRVRFSDYQEHLGKTMRAVAIEEALEVDRFGTVLALMERLRVLDSSEQWRAIRDLRSAVNHEYEDDVARLAEFFLGLSQAARVLMAMHMRLAEFCRQAYGISAPTTA